MNMSLTELADAVVALLIVWQVDCGERLNQRQNEFYENMRAKSTWLGPASIQGGLQKQIKERGKEVVCAELKEKFPFLRCQVRLGECPQ